ncbi:hypothetical protein D3C75_631320 [compost metagenome]
MKLEALGTGGLLVHLLALGLGHHGCLPGLARLALGLICPRFGGGGAGLCPSIPPSAAHSGLLIPNPSATASANLLLNIVIFLTCHLPPVRALLLWTSRE